MYIEKISLRNFRNIEDQTIGPFSESVNLVVGKNGSGKTNMLEAIGLSSLARSCRGAGTAEMVRFGSAAASVEIEGTAQKKKS
jgi:DNA replication and repair protein RecF